jgi:hypothetical protein
MGKLRQFWFKFEQMPAPTPVNLGCGVTAFSREDALSLLREKIFGENGRSGSPRGHRRHPENGA